MPESSSIPPRPLEVHAAFPVRTYDIDFSGTVSNIVYLRWLEDLRLTMLARYSPLDQHLRAGTIPVLSHTAIEYRTPLTITDTVHGHMWVSDIWRARWGLEAELGDGRRVCATARQTGIFVSLETRQPVRIPADLVALYRRHQDAGRAAAEASATY